MQGKLSLYSDDVKFQSLRVDLSLCNFITSIFSVIKATIANVCCSSFKLIHSGIPRDTDLSFTLYVMSMIYLLFITVVVSLPLREN